MKTFTPKLIVLATLVLAWPERAQPASPWVLAGKATVAGQRWDIPLGYDPGQKRFVILGGRTSFAEYRKPRPYDVLLFDSAMGQWENAFPLGKDWGPRFGPSRAPAWKDEVFGFQDVEKNVRPNWTVYGTFSLGQKYDYDPDTKCFYFYAGGRTFRYDPAARTWKDLAPAGDPRQELGGVLLWSSMCYDRHNKRFLLFGGGNVQSKRGDPGTWTYTPATNSWKRLRLDVEPPQRANSRLVYDPAARKVVLFGGDQLNQLLADTWTFDVIAGKWEEKKPPRGPAPARGMLCSGCPKPARSCCSAAIRTLRPPTTSPRSTSRSPWKRGSTTRPPIAGTCCIIWTSPRTARWAPPIDSFPPRRAADDTVLVLADKTWTCTIDAGKTDAAGTATARRRAGKCDAPERPA